MKKEEIKKKIEKFWHKAIRPAGHTKVEVLYRLEEGLPELCQLLSHSLSSFEKEVREEERKRISKAMQPAFDDFNAAAQTMIQSVDIRLERTGTEIIENIGYMKSILLSPQEVGSKEDSVVKELESKEVGE